VLDPVVVLGCVIVTVFMPFSTVAVTSAPLAPRTSTVATAPPLAWRRRDKSFSNIRTDTSY
jgi:hypothetical protein